jgi:hypothetical protein
VTHRCYYTLKHAVGDQRRPGGRTAAAMKILHSEYTSPSRVLHLDRAGELAATDQARQEASLSVN